MVHSFVVEGRIEPQRRPTQDRVRSASLSGGERSLYLRDRSLSVPGEFGQFEPQAMRAAPKSATSLARNAACPPWPAAGDRSPPA